MEQEKKSNIEEEFPNEKHGEVGDVTITEYRKNQMVRLAECFIVSPLCIYAGIRYRKELPKWLSASLVVFGTATLIYNGRNFIVNWNRDGKLIRQAIKQKKIEEKKIREKMIKVDGDVKKTNDVKEEKPVATPPVKKNNVEAEKKVDAVKPVSKELIVTPAKINSDKSIIEVAKNGSEKKSESNAIITNAQEISTSASEAVEGKIVKPKYDNNLKQIVITDSTPNPEITTANIIIPDAGIKENIELVSEKKKEVEAVTEIKTEQSKTDNNGNGSESATTLG